MDHAERASATRNGQTAAAGYAADLLELFYPVHYRVNMAVEDAMRGNLTRKQAAILWLIRSAGNDGGRWMRRKDIVVRLQDWFEVTSPAITQTLRRLARAPMGLVRLVEDAASAREKRVLLTPKGERFVSTMVKRGRGFLHELVEQLPEDQIGGGIKFLRAGILAFERLHGQDTGASRNGLAMRQRR
ncbi:MAG: MarR family winged helix-turn-helix transcriptional regulator [Candidatus Binataceae bacterium]